MRRNKLSIVVFAYNEEQNIGSLLKKVNTKKKRYHRIDKIFVIEDGSTDKTFQIIKRFKRKFPIEIWHNYPNIGFGRSYQLVIEKVAKILPVNDYILFIEGDNSSELEYLPKIFHKINKNFDLILCSRYHKRSRNIKVPLRRKIGSYSMNKFIRWYFKTKITDNSLLYKTYKIRTLEKVLGEYGDKLVTQKRFTAITEVLIKLLTLKPRPSTIEIPIIYNHGNRLGVSKMKIFKTLKEYFNLVKIIRTDNKKVAILKTFSPKQFSKQRKKK
jgi:glycosyltransferase involved in cell wall biosynthesis